MASLEVSSHCLPYISLYLISALEQHTMLKCICVYDRDESRDVAHSSVLIMCILFSSTYRFRLLKLLHVGFSGREP